MKLQYKILWLDDDINAFIDDEYIEDIRKHVTNQGFDTTIDTKDNSEDFFSALDETYDLILTDYHMNGLDGDKVVEKIREKSIFTEILFYFFNTTQPYSRTISCRKSKIKYLVNILFLNAITIICNKHIKNIIFNPKFKL
jgi:CheY-like chemotaxis protein